MKLCHAVYTVYVDTGCLVMQVLDD